MVLFALLGKDFTPVFNGWYTRYCQYVNFDLGVPDFCLVSRYIQRTLYQSDLCSLLLNNQNIKEHAKEFASTAHKNSTALELGVALFVLVSTFFNYFSSAIYGFRDV